VLKGEADRETKIIISGGCVIPESKKLDSRKHTLEPKLVPSKHPL
jgi:hypothetical protein